MAGVVLVTGGAGFIGRRVVRALVGRGEQVRVLDDLSTGRPGDVHPGAELIIGEITDAAAVAAAMAGVGRVVHLAARRAVPRSFLDPAGTDLVNRIGTSVVLGAASRAHVERVVFASSSSVYGDATVVPTPEVSEPSPLSPYATSKLAGEVLCRAAATRDLDTVCLRYFNVYGPGQPADEAYATLIPRVLEAIRRRETPTVHGDGEQRRDFTYIADAVRATLAALDAPGSFGGSAINVAGGQSWTVLAVIELLAAELGVPFAVRFIESRQGDPRCTQADLRLATSLLAYRPRVAVPEGLRRVAAHVGGVVTGV